jgi:hypothetical protein
MIKRLTIEIEEKLRNIARAKALTEGLTLKDLLTKFLKEYTGS